MKNKSYSIFAYKAPLLILGIIFSILLLAIYSLVIADRLLATSEGWLIRDTDYLNRLQFTINIVDKELQILNQQKQNNEQILSELKKQTIVIKKELNTYKNYFIQTIIVIEARLEQIERIIAIAQTQPKDKQLIADALITLEQHLYNLRQILQNTFEQITIHQKSTLKQVIKDEQNLALLMFILVILLVMLLVISVRNLQALLVKADFGNNLIVFPERNPNPVFSLNEDNEVIYANPAFRALIGKRRDQHHIVDIFPENFEEIKDKAQQSHSAWEQFDSIIGKRVLSVNIHWLKDKQFFLIHALDITEQKQAEEQLNYQAFHSPHTGLKNNYKLIQDVKSHVRQQLPFALIFIEIREYVNFVTGYGMNLSLDLVVKVTKRLKNLINNHEYDINLYQTYEHGFGLIVSGGVRCYKLHDFCRDIEQYMEKKLTTEAGEFALELDFGFCLFPEHGRDYNTLLQEARIALAEAVSMEHSSLVCYSSKLGDKVSEEIRLTSWLKEAINHNELHLVFQPQLALGTDEIIGVETLIRWHHNGEFISPGRFIPLAEKTGLIIPIGEWIIHQACSYGKKLIERVEQNLVVAINISPRQFRHPDFIETVQAILKETALPPACLELEITENVILHNELDTIEVLHRLKELGIQLSIDDFGTGYSSLSYLKQFPIDKLKVDQSFIKNLHQDNDDKAIVQVIIDLGKSLGLKVIAEGVEEIEQYYYLKSIDCDELQGYWYSHPLVKEELEIFIKTKNKANKLEKQS